MVHDAIYQHSSWFAKALHLARAVYSGKQLRRVWRSDLPDAYLQTRKIGAAIGSGPRYMICVTLFRTLREFRVRFSHGRVLFDSRNVQKRATKSDTSGHCLRCNGYILFSELCHNLHDLTGNTYHWGVSCAYPSVQEVSRRHFYDLVLLIRRAVPTSG